MAVIGLQLKSRKALFATSNAEPSSLNVMAMLLRQPNQRTIEPMKNRIKEMMEAYEAWTSGRMSREAYEAKVAAYRRYMIGNVS